MPSKRVFKGHCDRTHGCWRTHIKSLMHNRISAPLDDPHVGGLSRLHLNPCVPFFSHLMRISKAHVDPPAGDVMFSPCHSVRLVVSFHQKRISQIFGLQFVPTAEAVTLLWTSYKQCQKLCFISGWRAKHTVLYSAHLKRKLLCLILKHSWSCCRKCCFPWLHFFMLLKLELTSAPDKVSHV